MHLLLTTVLPFLAHDHPAAAAFLTCRSKNFHASIIPEFLSDEERVKSFYVARQRNQFNADREKQYANLFNLFIQTPLMQFSPSLVLELTWGSTLDLDPLLETKYFTRTLQHCFVDNYDVVLSNDLFHALSKVQSLTKLDLYRLESQHIEIIINTFPSLETLTIYNAENLTQTAAMRISSQSPPPASTKTLRSLTLEKVDSLFATQFIPQFSNLQKLKLSAHTLQTALDLLPLLSSLPLLGDMFLRYFGLENTESLKNLVHLSSLEFISCCVPNLSFLTQENSLPHLSQLLIDNCYGVSTSSHSSLSHASSLHSLKFAGSEFNNDSLQYLENMIHLRKLDLNESKITGDSRSLKTMMQNLFQLEELNLHGCRLMGNQGAIAGALYSTRSQLRVLKIGDCNLVDDDLLGIGALKNSLEELDLRFDLNLTNEALEHCGDLVKLKVLKLDNCVGINDLSPLKDCLSLEELDVSRCTGLTDDSFKVFSKDPNSFPRLHVLGLWDCKRLTAKAFEHLSKNNNLVYQLKELNISGVSEMLFSSTFFWCTSARSCICQLKGLRRLYGIGSCARSESDQTKLKCELLRSLKNLDVIY